MLNNENNKMKMDIEITNLLLLLLQNLLNLEMKNYIKNLTSRKELKSLRKEKEILSVPLDKEKVLSIRMELDIKDVMV